MPQADRLKTLRETDPEKYIRLRAEAQTPYRGIRQFIYAGSGISAAIGGVVFFFQILAGRELGTAIPNFALQAGVFALMVWLYGREQRASAKMIDLVREREKDRAENEPHAK
jgi:Low psii accumulation1 / Rep27